MPNSTTQNLNKTLNFLENSMAAQKVHGFEEIFALILLGQFQFWSLSNFQHNLQTFWHYNKVSRLGLGLEIWIFSNFQHNLQTFWNYNKVGRLGLGLEIFEFSAIFSIIYKLFDTTIRLAG